jgi:hypothetical protein
VGIRCDPVPDDINVAANSSHLGIKLLAVPHVSPSGSVYLAKMTCNSAISLRLQYSYLYVHQSSFLDFVFFGSEVAQPSLCSRVFLPNEPVKMGLRHPGPRNAPPDTYLLLPQLSMNVKKRRGDD